LIHHSSDTLDSLTKEYVRDKIRWSKQALSLYGFFKNEIDNLLEKFTFANKYIKDCIGPTCSLMRLKRAIQ